jgi:uncharacterized lipoprotein YajG
MQIGKIIGLLGALCLVVAGCQLVPKPVELGQKKVREVPTKTSQQVEAEKQAADFVAKKIDQGRDEALKTQVSTNVIEPLTDARDAAHGLRQSLGAPMNTWNDNGAEMALRLGFLEAKLDRALAEHRKEVAPLVGKKIEGTGWIQIPYFMWIGLVLLFFFVLWTGLKIVGAIYPIVGLGVSGLSAAGRVGSSTVTKALEQVVKGGEAFKDSVNKLDLDDRAKSVVLDLLRKHQMMSQDTDIQELIRKMTR